jgi:hypothetical protein
LTGKVDPGRRASRNQSRCVEEVNRINSRTLGNNTRTINGNYPEKQRHE